QQPVGDIAQHGLVLGEEELLEHEPDPGRPQRGHLPVGHRRHVEAGVPHRPRPRTLLGHLPQFQHRNRNRNLGGGCGGRDGRRRAGGHDAATTTRCPAASAPVTCTRPGVSSKIPGAPGTYRRTFPGPATSTTYPPGDRASSAVTGTASTSRAVAVVMYTVTGAWSSAPAAPGSVSRTCTGIVVTGPSCPDVVVATVPTTDTTPGVVVSSGSVTVTASPALTSDSWETSSGIITTCSSDVAAMTGPDAGPPRLPVTW